MTMIRHSLILAVATATIQAYATKLPEYEIITTGTLAQSSSGQITRVKISSHHLADELIVDVWTPEGYRHDDDVKYPTIYAHDGQNLFDSALCYGGVAWELDDLTSKLIDNDSIVAPIIVGIHNRGAKRASDYFPEKALNFIFDSDKNETKIFETCHDEFLGDEEAAFVATELKPLIDNLFDTNPDQQHTFAMGSSMGGLASAYLMCEYPDIFGGVACLSTHWIGSLDFGPDFSMTDDSVCATAILSYLKSKLPSPTNHRIYFDRGTGKWDAGYAKYETIARQIAAEVGYGNDNGTLETYDAVGADHNESSWQKRVDRPIKFLIGKANYR